MKAQASPSSLLGVDAALALQKPASALFSGALIAASNCSLRPTRPASEMTWGCTTGQAVFGYNRLNILFLLGYVVLCCLTDQWHTV